MALVCAFASGRTRAEDGFSWERFLGRNDLVWDKLGDHWIQSPFIGNGEMGAMIYHEFVPRPGHTKRKPVGMPGHVNGEGWLRFDLSRNDLYTAPTGAGMRVPTGHVYLKPAGKVKSSRARLDLWNAEAAGEIETDQGRITWRAFAHALGNLIFIELKTEGGESACRIEYEPRRAENMYLVVLDKPVGPGGQQPEPVVTRPGDVTLSVQPWNGGGGAATATREIKAGGTRYLVASLAVNWSDPAPADAVCAAVTSKTAGDIASARAAHRTWWHGFYPKSFLSMPDARLESFYWIQLYKMASATRGDKAALDLMGPWYQPTMWPKYWMNLNIQLAYWPVYTANHLELGESLVNWVSAKRDSLVQNAPKEWQQDSAALPRATGLDLRGDVRNNGKELGNLTFLLHNLYLQCRYSMDDRMLRDTLYPLLARSVNFYRHVMIRKEDGKYHLPLAISPEYGPAEDCNYDLALLRWCRSGRISWRTWLPTRSTRMG
jgi:alpha-L-fucosidase 2